MGLVRHRQGAAQVDRAVAVAIPDDGVEPDPAVDTRLRYVVGRIGEIPHIHVARPVAVLGQSLDDRSRVYILDQQVGKILVVDRRRVVRGEVEIDRGVVVEVHVAPTLLPLDRVDRLRTGADLPVRVPRRLVEGERRRVPDGQLIGALTDDVVERIARDHVDEVGALGHRDRVNRPACRRLADLALDVPGELGVRAGQGIGVGQCRRPVAGLALAQGELLVREDALYRQRGQPAHGRVE